MSLSFRYWRRYGTRPLVWAVRLGTIGYLISGTTVVLDFASREGMIFSAILYGIWEITRTLRAQTRFDVTVVRGEKLIVESGATISVPKNDIDRLLRIIAEKEVEKGGVK